MCVCVCVCEREREREIICSCECVHFLKLTSNAPGCINSLHMYNISGQTYKLLIEIN